MTPTRVIFFALRDQLLDGVLPDRFQHPVARTAVPAVVELHQVFADQRRDVLEHHLVERGVRRTRPVGCFSGNGFGGIDREPPGEDRQPPEHPLVVRFERFVAPRDRVAHRAVARLLVAQPAFSHASRRSSRSRSTAGAPTWANRAAASSIASGIPSKPAQIAATSAAFAGGEGEAGLGGPRPLHEELDRLASRDRLRYPAHSPSPAPSLRRQRRRVPSRGPAAPVRWQAQPIAGCRRSGDQ